MHILRPFIAAYKANSGLSKLEQEDSYKNSVKIPPIPAEKINCLFGGVQDFIKILNGSSYIKSTGSRFWINKKSFKTKISLDIHLFLTFDVLMNNAFFIFDFDLFWWKISGRKLHFCNSLPQTDLKNLKMIIFLYGYDHIQITWYNKFFVKNSRLYKFNPCL